ncbi:MAG: hypothetical protein IJF47_02090 [Candidatus Methanomethylophilaceae archaeon]|nr:carboxymuconolactone decarboxylase family protein [Thermoplasmata archaeon]MBQ2762487.1 hypothetical protein [Candidatus Methanomethylophilaceae archaeon]
MRFIEEYFPEFVEAMDEVDAASEMKRPIDDKTFHLICFALAARTRSSTSLKAHFHAAIKCGASLRELAYVMSVVENEGSRMDDTWMHDTLGDWTQLTRDEYDSGCRCGVVRRY